ncbi:hypothetical protein [Nannocystis pusilla]|uniref:hypothetical protein n=1 Tax=Nannocystis pusilla TaxID=889268 RepID=UPI003DA4EC97
MTTFERLALAGRADHNVLGGGGEDLLAGGVDLTAVGVDDAGGLVGAELDVAPA